MWAQCHYDNDNTIMCVIQILQLMIHLLWFVNCNYEIHKPLSSQRSTSDHVITICLTFYLSDRKLFQFWLEFALTCRQSVVMFEVKFHQGLLLKKAIDAIKELFPLTLWDCSHEGIAVRSTDLTNNCFVQFRLGRDAFQEFRCDRRFTIGVDLKEYYTNLFQQIIRITFLQVRQNHAIRDRWWHCFAFMFGDVGPNQSSSRTDR